MTTFLGNPVTLEGVQLKVGDKFPEFTVVGEDLADFEPGKSGKRKLYLAVPSVDTPVCSMELGKFVQAVQGQDDVDVVAISMDLPFAQARWSQEHDNKTIKMGSDYKDRAFAKAAGTRMKENGLEARSVFVVSPDNTVEYVEYVEEVGNEPDYDKALKAAGLK